MMPWLESLSAYEAGQAGATRLRASDETRRRTILHRTSRTNDEAREFEITDRLAGQVRGLDLPAPGDELGHDPAHRPLLTPAVLVGGGLALLLLTWLMIVGLVVASEGSAALVAGVANVASVAATLLLIRGARRHRRRWWTG